MTKVPKLGDGYPSISRFISWTASALTAELIIPSVADTLQRLARAQLAVLNSKHQNLEIQHLESLVKLAQEARRDTETLITQARKGGVVVDAASFTDTRKTPSH